MDVLAAHEAAQKFETLKGLAEAVAKARDLRDSNPGWRNSVLYQKALLRYKEFRALIPTRLVYSV